MSIAECRHFSALVIGVSFLSRSPARLSRPLALLAPEISEFIVIGVR